MLRFIPGSSKFKNQDEMGAVILQRRMERTVAMNKPLAAAAAQAFRSFIRAYATHSSDTKGIFRVESLHLGHAAKSFALRDKPTALRGGHDVIGQIFNGVYAESVGPSKGKEESDRVLKKRVRDEKFSLSGKLVNDNSSSSSSSKRKKLNGNDSPTMERASVSSVLKKGKDRQKLRKMGSSSDTDQKGGSKVVGKNFRKTNGYFRKKLRAQTTAEFSLG